MTRSETLFEQAKKTIPGGVNSPVRAFNGVGGTLALSKKPMAHTSMMPTARPISITWVRGAR